MKIARGLIIVILPILVFGIAYVTVSGLENSTSPEKLTTDITDVEVLNNSNEKELYNILLLGEDESERLTDVVVLVSCDTKNGKINILQIPRDTYAEYTSAAYRKINAASDVLGGGRLLADFLTENLGIPIDSYIAIDMNIIAEAVDILGGVEIDVPMDMSYTDPYQDLEIEIKKGVQVIDGEKAKQFVRYREGYLRGDLDRLDAQKLFIAAFLKKITEKDDLLTVVQLANSILPKTDSDISYKECLDIIKRIGIPNMNNITLMTLPGCDIQGSSGAWYYVMNRASAYKMIKENFNPSIVEINFDKERRFTSVVRSGFNAIYEAKSGFETKIYSAEKINGGIEIESKYD